MTLHPGDKVMCISRLIPSSMVPLEFEAIYTVAEFYPKGNKLGRYSEPEACDRVVLVEVEGQRYNLHHFRLVSTRGRKVFWRSIDEK